MTDLQLIILSASIMKAAHDDVEDCAGNLIDDAQKLLLEAYKREIAHKDHAVPNNECFICQMNTLLKNAQKGSSGPTLVKPS